MGPLRRMFGQGMRVQVLEALLEMGSGEFTRGELADLHGLERKSVNRVFADLVREGFVEQAARGPRPVYRVREGSLRLHLLIQFESALSLVERAGLEDASSDAGRQFAATFGQALQATVKGPQARDVRKSRRRPPRQRALK